MLSSSMVDLELAAIGAVAMLKSEYVEAWAVAACANSGAASAADTVAITGAYGQGLGR